MNDNRNYTPAGQPVTQPLYNGQPVYTAPQNPAPVREPDAGVYISAAGR